MLKITGLDGLQRELEETQRALEMLDGELGTVNFNPDDPSSIEAAIQTMYKMIEDRAGMYASNPIVGSLIDQMKEAYRENILQKAAEARLQENEGE
jgi:diketogulonate reductase-like aldo/keto reductase